MNGREEIRLRLVAGNEGLDRGAMKDRVAWGHPAPLPLEEVVKVKFVVKSIEDTIELGSRRGIMDCEFRSCQG
jgi:hypothetical protein